MILFSTPKSKQRGFFLNPYRFSVAVVVAGEHKAIFGYGSTGSNVSMSNLVSTAGIVATDTTGVGTARAELAAAGYGTDKAIFGYGYDNSLYTAVTNLVANTGVIAADTAGVGTARYALAAAGYGTDKAIFGYGYGGFGSVSTSNLVSNTGVVSTDTTGVGTGRNALAAAGYGTDKAIFGYGSITTSVTNLVSNTGVVATDTAGVGTARFVLAASGYGTDKALFGYGYSGGNLSMTNKVSNTGVVSTDTAGVGTARRGLAAAGYGADKAIFGYGLNGGNSSLTNLVSNTGVVASDTAGVGTARYQLAAASYGYGVVTSVPSFSNVKLLLHMDGVNDSTTFTDSSSTPKTGTAAGNAKLTTTGSKFGSACGTFDGAGDVVTYNHASFILGTVDFCLEGWIKIPSVPAGSRGFFALYTIPSVAPYVYGFVNSAGKIVATCGANTLQSTTVLSADTWYHFAVTRSAGTARLFVSGALEVSVADTTNFSDTRYFSLGGGENITGSSSYHIGQLDDFRLVVGEPVYTVAFTPPAAAFANS